jgi:hypothetical protein
MTPLRHITDMRPGWLFQPASAVPSRSGLAT